MVSCPQRRREYSKPVSNTTPEAVCMMPNHPVLLVIHQPYALPRSVRPFKKPDTRIGTDTPKERPDKSIEQKAIKKIMLHVHVSDITVVQLCVLSN